MFLLSLANQMLEQLYQREIVEKPIEKQNLRLEVAQLMEKMYEEQQSKITKYVPVSFSLSGACP